MRKHRAQIHHGNQMISSVMVIVEQGRVEDGNSTIGGTEEPYLVKAGSGTIGVHVRICLQEGVSVSKGIDRAQ